MGNLKDLIKQNKHLKSQNEVILGALKRKNAALKAETEKSDAAVKELSTLTAAYIGALCLTTGESVQIRHDLIKKVLEEYNVIVTTSETGFTFSIEEKVK
jgi:hypothetical protein